VDEIEHFLANEMSIEGVKVIGEGIDIEQ